MKLKKLGDNDSERWDRFVTGHPKSSIYHLSGWKKVIETSFPHIQADILALVDDGSDQIVAGLPVYCVKSGLHRNKLVSIPFALQGNALVSSDEQLRMLIDGQRQRMRQRGAQSAEIRNAEPQPALLDLNFSVSNAFVHQYVPVDRSPDLLKKQFHKKAVQASIDKAVAHGVKLQINNSKMGMDAFYELLSRSRKRLGLPCIPYAFFDSLWEEFRGTNQIDILLATYRGRIAGGSLLLKFRETVIVEYGCDLLSYRKYCINHFLDWNSILLTYDQGYKKFSFGRTALSNGGLITYKRRWGAISEIVPIYHYPGHGSVDNEAPYKTIANSIARNIFAKSPESLYRIFSRIFYRYIR
jgi:hypothetical protein